MSGTQRPTPQRRELEIMRVLFERRLKDRAIALADSRWPGSGKMVSLAYEWGQLSPEQRRQQLSNIGPEEISRLREFAELNPSLAAAITELDRRGALPHIEAAAVDIAAASREARETPPGEPFTDAAAEPATDSVPDPTVADEIEAQAFDSSAGSTFAEPEPAAEIPEPIAETPIELEYGFEDRDINPLEIDMPDLDLGLPSTTEFLEDQATRREEAARATEESMQRVRQRLEQSAQRAMERGSAFTMPKLPDVSRSALSTGATSLATGSLATGSAATRSAATRTAAHDSASEFATRQASRAIEAPRSLAREFEERAVVSLRPDDPRPSDDQLVALANDLQIGLSEHHITFENRKQEFGGLVNEFGRITAVPGRLARAVAEPMLVVVRGRMLSPFVERLEEGYFDIPGTRATVRLHPKARVLLIGD